jgi:hypothetical protein
MRIERTKKEIQRALDHFYAQASRQEKAVSMEDVCDLFEELGQPSRVRKLGELV